MIKLFDSHAHLNFPDGTEDENLSVIRRIGESDVAYVVDVGFDLESSMHAAGNAAYYPWCFAAVGIHPLYSSAISDDILELLENTACQNGVKAIGEIGLDYHDDSVPKDVQQFLFRRQLQLALRLGMPVVIHSRSSHGDVMDILKEEGAFSEERKACFPQNPDSGISDARVLLHTYSGSAEQALRYVDLGATISVSGTVTYMNSRKPVAVAEAVPLSHLLIETDAPFLTPEPVRGERNESPFLEYTARKVAEIKGLSYEEVADATMQNGLRFFDIAIGE